MSDILASAEAWLSTQRELWLSKLVTVRRGVDETPSVSAMHGSTLAENQTADGLSLRSKVSDFVIEVSDYQIDAVAVEPLPGDQIILDDGRVFELMELGDEKCWRWHNRAGTTYRIHTRYVGDE